MQRKLARTFFSRSAREVAKDLLGKTLVRLHDGQRVAGIIVETEAYCDTPELDLACHGHRTNKGRPTARTAVMFGPPGYSYVYFTYGMHWMFNVVTGKDGQASAVLIRALEPLEGLDLMIARRKKAKEQLTNGPAKLAQALNIDHALNEVDLCAPDSCIWIEVGQHIPLSLVQRGPRIGLGSTPEPWLSKPWRFWIDGNPFVSK